MKILYAAKPTTRQIRMLSRCVGKEQVFDLSLSIFWDGAKVLGWLLLVFLMCL
jgi:hypothetical protein